MPFIVEHHEDLTSVCGLFPYTSFHYSSSCSHTDVPLPCYTLSSSIMPLFCSVKRSGLCLGLIASALNPNSISECFRQTDCGIKESGKQNEKAEPTSNDTVVGSSNAAGGSPPEDKEQTVKCAFPGNLEDIDETDWQDGSVSISSLREDSSGITKRGLTVEFCESLPSVTRKVTKRASAEDKVNHTAVHAFFLGRYVFFLFFFSITYLKLQYFYCPPGISGACA